MNATHYDITFKGEAGTATRAAFGDLPMSVGHGVTVLRAELPDQGALRGVLDRIAALGLELTEVRLVVNEDEQHPGTDGSSSPISGTTRSGPSR